MTAVKDAGPSDGEVRVRCSASGVPKPPPRAEAQKPFTMVIFGASGDLTARKLIPALYRLYGLAMLPGHFLIVGSARTEMNHDAFRRKMAEAVQLQGSFDEERWRTFAERLFYHPVDYGTLSTFQALGGFLEHLEQRGAMKGNRLFDLAIPPSLYETTVGMMGRAGLAEEDESGNRWVRLIIEKPFGHDLDSARTLDRTIHEHFREHQIFRIDHYLAKETVQNILIFRFANAIFEPLWNRNYIGAVSIIAAETVGVEHRAGYYDDAGVLRDMFQNHMMQLLAVTAMEPPSHFDAARVRDEKVKVFRSLRPFSAERANEEIVLGQYGRGVVEGRKMPSYVEEQGIRPDSRTPTFAALRVHIDNWRWQGVPFYLTSGKRLARKRTEIAVDFREVPHALFRNILDRGIGFNRLVLGIQPDEKITLTFQTKTPGQGVDLRPVTMDFDYRQGAADPAMEAYEKVLLDVLLGDQMLFWRQDGLELTWAFLTPLISHCEGSVAPLPLEIYESGGGPEGAKDVMRRHGQW